MNRNYIAQNLIKSWQSVVCFEVQLLRRHIRCVNRCSPLCIYIVLADHMRRFIQFVEEEENGELSQ